MTRRHFTKWIIAVSWACIIMITTQCSTFRGEADKGSLTPAIVTPQVEAAPTEQPKEAGAGPLLSFFILSDLHVNSGFTDRSGHLRKSVG